MKTAHSRVVWYPVCWYVCNTSSQTFAVSQVSSTTVKVVAADTTTTTAAVAADTTTTTATVAADPATTSTAAVLTTSSMKIVIFLWASLLVCCSCYQPNGNSGTNGISIINISINNNKNNMSFVQARRLVSTCSMLGNPSSWESFDAQLVCLGLVKNVSRDIRVRIEAHIKNSIDEADLSCPPQSVYRTRLESMFKEAKAQIPFSCKSVRKLELILLPKSNLTSDQKNKMAAFLKLQKYYCNEEYHFNVVYDYYMKVISKCAAMGTNACESNQARLVCTERLEGFTPGYIPSNIRRFLIKDNAGGSCHGTKATKKFKENLRNLFTRVSAAMPPDCHTIEAIEKVTNTSNFGLDRTQMRSVLGYLENSKQGCQEVDKQQDFYNYYKSITGECKPIGRPSHPCEVTASQLVCLGMLDLGHDHNKVKQSLYNHIVRSFLHRHGRCPTIDSYRVPLKKLFVNSGVSLPLTCTDLTALRKENNKAKPFKPLMGPEHTRRLNAFILDKQLTMGCSIR